ncbi:hypothetical protein DFJ73DRAFT_898038 [Zopfochytrium polystomum]|nr:hypothetical protein DFJ73DRAFT_898038 [Zopfochytrium polystomum]
MYLNSLSRHNGQNQLVFFGLFVPVLIGFHFGNKSWFEKWIPTIAVNSLYGSLLFLHKSVLTAGSGFFRATWASGFAEAAGYAEMTAPEGEDVAVACVAHLYKEASAAAGRDTNKCVAGEAYLPSGVVDIEIALKKDLLGVLITSEYLQIGCIRNLCNESRSESIETGCFQSMQPALRALLRWGKGAESGIVQGSVRKLADRVNQAKLSVQDMQQLYVAYPESFSDAVPLDVLVKILF